MSSQPRAVILDRLRKLLEQLDEKFQSEGLMPEETDVRTLVRQVISMEKVFALQFPDEGLWVGIGLTKSDGEDLSEITAEVKRARDRIHLLEGDSATVGKLLEAVGRLANELKIVTERVNRELDEKERDAGL